MKPVGLLLLVILAACSSQRPLSPRNLSEPDPNPACYRLPPEQWGACLERARAIDFNVYECERRALSLKPATANPGEAADE